MKTLAKKYLFFLVMIVTIYANCAYAAEATLTVKAKIVRCVTMEERQQMCNQENLCCGLLDTENVIAFQTSKETGDTRVSTQFNQIGNNNLHFARNTRNNLARKTTRIAVSIE